MPFWSVLPARSSCVWWLAAVALTAAVARCHMQPVVKSPASPIISSSVTLLWRSPCCLSMDLKAIVVVEKMHGRSREKELAVGARAQPRRLLRWSYGARCRLPASSTMPSNLLAEGQPYFFLPAWMRKWRQFSLRSVSTASFFSKLGGWKRGFRSPVVPSGLVPGDGEVIAERQLRTRLRSSFSVQGLSCKSEGPVCNLLFYVGPDVNCSVSRLHFFY